MSTNLVTQQGHVRQAQVKHNESWNESHPGAVYNQVDIPKVTGIIGLQSTNPFGKFWLELSLRLALMVWSVKSSLNDHAKRVFDLLICLIVIPLATPLMLLTAVAIRVDSPGPILFKQQRVGKWGKRFSCYKFRSMYIDAEARKAELMAMNEADEVVFKIKNDPRITGVGRVIRKSSIDELPQLFNVLKGEMSFVGPRPPVPYEVEQYEFDHFRRLDAVPGITGLQQVSGRSTLTFRRWVELDVEYIETQSLGKDVEILARTVPTVISRKGAY